jgi:DNA-binding transcriptional regulator of glucitol operon
LFFAGAIEISLADIIGVLLVLTVIYVVLPSAGGWLALRRYRSSRDPEQQTTLGAIGSFVLGFVLVSVAIGLFAWVSEMLVA